MSSPFKKPTIMRVLLPQDHQTPSRRMFETLKARIDNDDCPALSEMMILKREYNTQKLGKPPKPPLLRKGTTYRNPTLIRHKSTFESKIDTIQQELDSDSCSGYYRQILEMVFAKKEFFLGQDEQLFPFSDSDCDEICHVLDTELSSDTDSQSS